MAERYDEPHASIQYLIASMKLYILGAYVGIVSRVLPSPTQGRN
jgi:hypothetical protein